MIGSYYRGSIVGMKLSVRMSEEDVAFVDEYASTHAFGSRSAVLRRAVALLRSSELGEAYERAWDEWSEEADVWDIAVGDGLTS